MPRYVILGAGRQGKALALFLSRNTDARISFVDFDQKRSAATCAELEVLVPWAPKEQFVPLYGDVSDTPLLRSLIRGHDVCISALPHQFNLTATEAAIAEGVNFCDYGFDTEIIKQQLALSNKARGKNVTIVPNNGIAPGLASILAYQIANETDCDAVKIYVGGLSQHRPRNAVGYEELFENLLDEYLGEQTVLENGACHAIPLPAGLEKIRIEGFKKPFEAFLINSPTSFMVARFQLEGRIKTFWEKAIRYPGHYRVLKALQELGFFDKDPLAVQNTEITPLEVTKKLFSANLPKCRDDILIFQILFEKNDKLARKILMIMHCAPMYGLTAMQIATSIPVAVTAELLAERKIEPGAFLPEFKVGYRHVMEEFRRISATFFPPEIVFISGV